MPIANLAGEFAEAVWLIVVVTGPLMAFAWIIHLLEWLMQRRLSSRFGWNSVLWTGWLGTPVHELSHVVMCLVFRHEIVDMALFRPDRANGRLGYVVHSFRSGNLYQEIGNFFIGVAPLIGGTAALLGLLMLFFPDTGQQSLFQTDLSMEFWGQVASAMSGLFAGLFQTRTLFTFRLWLFLYLVVCIGSHMGPSTDDYRGARKGVLLVLGILLASSLVLALFGTDSAAVLQSARGLMVPVMTILMTAIALCSLATAMVYLITDLYDRIRT